MFQLLCIKRRCDACNPAEIVSETAISALLQKAQT